MQDSHVKTASLIKAAPNSCPMYSIGVSKRLLYDKRNRFGITTNARPNTTIKTKLIAIHVFIFITFPS